MHTNFSKYLERTVDDSLLVPNAISQYFPGAKDVKMSNLSKLQHFVQSVRILEKCIPLTKDSIVKISQNLTLFALLQTLFPKN